MPSEPLHSLDLNLLKVFDAVMTERSLTRAAQALALTQPAVSNAMRRLRDAVGDDLLVRHGRTLVPTARAQTLWLTVRECLQDLRAALAPLPFDPNCASQTFVLTMADATAAELMPALVAYINTHAPQIALRVVPLTTRDPRRLLDEGHADLAVGNFPAAMADLAARAQCGETPAIQHQRLFQGDYVCVMRKEHPLAAQSLTLDQFCAARHMLVSFSGRAYGFIDQALESLGRQRQVVLTVNQFFTAGKIVAQSDLLTVLPRHFIRVTGFADQVRTCELPFPAPTIEINALWHQRLQHDRAHAWLREQVLALAANAYSA